MASHGPKTMADGVQEWIDFTASDGKPRKAKLTSTDVINRNAPIIEHTQDPDWIVRNPDGSQNGPAQWIGVQGLDGRQRKVRVASEFQHNGAAGDRITSDLVHCNNDGSDEKRDHSIGLLDSNGNIFYLGIQDVHQFPGVPGMYIHY